MSLEKWQHPWDLYWTWYYTSDPTLQRACVIKGVLGEEAALYSMAEHMRCVTSHTPPREI